MGVAKNGARERHPTPAYPGLPSAMRIVRRQDGMVTAAQLQREGLTRRQIERLVRRCGWVRPFVGIYLVPDAHPTVALARAALRRRPDGVVCDITAARLLGLGALPPPPSLPPTSLPPSPLPPSRPGSASRALEPVHLLVDRTTSRTPSPGLVLHAGDAPADQIMTRSGFPVTTVGRTLADLVLRWDRPTAVALLDAALHDGRLRDLAAVRAALFGRLGSAPRRAWLLEVDGRAESPLESRLRLVLRDAGLGPEELQYRVLDDSGRAVARCDFAWPSRRLLVEADGARYHGDRLTDPAPLHGDRERQNRLVRLGWRVLRFTWTDVTTHPARVIAAVADLVAGTR